MDVILQPKTRPPLWREPGIIGIVLFVIGAGGWVLLENKLMPPKQVDITTRVPVPGGGSFCDPVKLPQSTR